jgi:hypothetical protein
MNWAYIRNFYSKYNIKTDLKEDRVDCSQMAQNRTKSGYSEQES